MRTFGQGFVKLHCQLTDIGVPEVLHPGLHLVVDPTQARTLGSRRALGGNARCKLIQRGSDGEDLEDLFLGNPTHHQAAAHLSRGEPFRFQSKDGLTNGRSTDAELARKLLLAQPIARLELPNQDCLAECGIGRVGGGNRAGVLLPQSSEWCWPI